MFLCPDRQIVGVGVQPKEGDIALFVRLTTSSKLSLNNAWRVDLFNVMGLQATSLIMGLLTITFLKDAVGWLIDHGSAQKENEHYSSFRIPSHWVKIV